MGSSTAPLQPVITATALRSIDVASPVPTRGSRLYVGQTLGAGTAPYEIGGVNVDPLSGLLAQPLDVPDGPLRVATYADADTALVFTDTTPQEGSEAFSLITLGSAYDSPSAALVEAPASGMVDVVTVNDAVRMPSVGTGAIQVQLTGAMSASYDEAFVVVSDINGIVATQWVSGSGTLTVNVPAGSQAAALGSTAIYTVAVRAAGLGGALRWVRATSMVDLRSVTSASVSLALP